MTTVFDCDQGSPKWFKCRMGIPTASEFSTVMMKGKDGGPSKTRRTYMLKLAGEKITGIPMESHTNNYMERGKVMETEARSYYELISNIEVSKVGFIRCDTKNAGASPDGLIGNDGMLEIKTQAPHLLIETLQADQVPPEHVAQLQGNLWIAEREWIDLMVYYSRMPPLVKHVTRDEAYIKKLDAAVRRFNEELDEIVGRIRSL